MVASKTLRQTRSDSGDTKAVGQSLPRIRTFLNVLYRCPQARLRTLPGLLGNRGDLSSEIKARGQEGRVEVALHWPNPAVTLMPALPERLLDIASTAMTILRQFGCGRWDFMQGAASFCNCAFQQLYKHPWSTKPNTFAILSLPCLIGNLFEANVCSNG